MIASHGCGQAKVKCSSCHACKRLRFVELVTLKSGEQIRVTRCTHCDYPQEAVTRG